MTPAPPGLGERGCRAGERWSGCRAGQRPRQQRCASIRGRSTRADPPPDARGGFADGLLPRFARGFGLGRPGRLGLGFRRPGRLGLGFGRDGCVGLDLLRSVGLRRGD